MSDDDTLPEADRAEGAPHPRETVDLIGQDAAETQVLTALAEGRLHHAWLLTGSEGVGKATLAWRMARHLLSTPVDDGGGLFGAPEPATSLAVDPETPVARRMAALSEPRLFLLRRAWDTEKKRHKAQIGVEDVRRLKSFFALSAAEGGRRVAIIDSADDLNVAAANALLKILEEPPRDSVILLVSHRPSRLLPTIRSRCRVVRLEKLSATDLQRIVQTTGGVDPDSTSRLAALSDGSAGEALRLQNLDGLDLFSRLVDVFQTAPRLDRSKALALIETLTARGAEEKLSLYVRLFELLLARLARTGAGRAPGNEGAAGEIDMLRRLSPNATAAQAWAQLQQTLAARVGHARAVNLDPHQLLLDMFLQVDDVALRHAAPAKT